MPLADLQRRFLGYLAGDGDGQDHADALDDIRGSRDLAPDDRLAIYRNSYHQRLIGALREDSPMLRHLLGDEQFDALALGYIAAHPSKTPNLRWYGEGLPAWLARADDYARYPLLAELAEWERLLRQAFDGPDHAVLTLQHLQTLPASDWPLLALRLVPTAALHRQRFNTTAIWQALKAGTEPPEQVLLDEPAVWVIWRKDLQTLYRSVSPEEQPLLDSVSDGTNFADLCANLVGLSEEEIPGKALGWLQHWIGEGLLRSVEGACAAAEGCGSFQRNFPSTS